MTRLDGRPGEGERKRALRDDGAFPTPPAAHGALPGDRTGRKPTPLHRGFGFGPNEIVARAADAARAAHAQRDARIREAVGIPLPQAEMPLPKPTPAMPQLAFPVGVGQGRVSVGALPKAGQANRLASAPIAVLEDGPGVGALRPSPSATGSAPADRAFDIPFERGSDLTGPSDRRPESVGGSGLTREFLSPAQKVGRARAFLAWLLDAGVGCATLVVSAVLTYSAVPVTVSERISSFLSRLGYAPLEAHVSLVTWLAQFVVISIALNFLVQFVSASVLGASVGRFGVGLTLQRDRPWLRRWQSACAAFSEALTFGGLLSLPLVLIAPDRVPLFPWVRYHIGQDTRMR